jgi:uncharacterized protein YceK
MKYLIFLVVMLSGCSTMSEYNRGCRDGLTYSGDVHHNDEGRVNGFCDTLEAIDRTNREMDRKLNRK